jgi:hypothetical protein
MGLHPFPANAADGRFVAPKRKIARRSGARLLASHQAAVNAGVEEDFL